MNQPPPEHQASSSSSSSSPSERTRRPPTTAKNKGRDPHDREDTGDGAEELRPWADIAVPLLEVLLPRLTLVDRTILSFVCRSWHSFMAGHPSLLRPPFPWLVLSQQLESPFLCSFYSHSDSSTFPLSLAGADDFRACIASSHGWLCFSCTRGKRVHVFLFNPLSRARIDLPADLPACPSSVTCAALSTAPTEPNCTVLVLSRRSLRFWNIYRGRIGGKAWYAEAAQFILRSNMAVVSGKIYFMCCEGLAVIDTSIWDCPLKWLKMNDDVLPKQNAYRRKYSTAPSYYHWLVESNGDLLIVTLLRVSGKIIANVCRADFTNRMWAEADDPCDRSLFLSEGACLSLPAPAKGDASEYGDNRVYLSGNSINDELWREYTVCRGGSLEQRYQIGSRMAGYSFHHSWFMPALSTLS